MCCASFWPHLYNFPPSNNHVDIATTRHLLSIIVKCNARTDCISVCVCENALKKSYYWLFMIIVLASGQIVQYPNHHPLATPPIRHAWLLTKWLVIVSSNLTIKYMSIIVTATLSVTHFAPPFDRPWFANAYTMMAYYRYPHSNKRTTHAA